MAGTQYPAFNNIQELLNNHQRLISSDGKPVIGWFCSYTPLEILIAAGLHPYRIVPEPGRAMTRADGYIDRNFCPYVRTCLGEALDGRYEFLDGLVVVNSCDPMRRMYDVWRYNIEGAFVHLLDLPRINSTNAVNYFCDCLQKLVDDIEKQFVLKVTDAALSEAIDAINKNRSRLRELYRINQNMGMPLSAANVRAVVRASSVLPLNTFNGLLEHLLDEIGDIVATEIEGPRILITGSVMDNPQILELVELYGAQVVGDDLCTGTRLFWDTAKYTGESLADLSRYYLGRTPCPRMKDAPRRFEHVLQMVDEFRVDGVIFYTLKFCDPFLFDVPLLREKLVARGLSTLMLEGDYTPGTLGRVRTRIEAFIEMLRENVRAT